MNKSIKAYKKKKKKENWGDYKTKHKETIPIKKTAYIPVRNIIGYITHILREMCNFLALDDKNKRFQ